MKHFESLLSAIAATMLLAACSSTPDSTDSAAKASTSTATPTAPPSTAGTAPAPASQVATVTIPPHKDPAHPLFAERSVYFDYDDFSVKDKYNDMLARHGRYLQSQPALAIRVEGHADERGSAEYNLSLGQKRAEAVLRALKIIGVADARMEAVSYGEERPKAPGSGEAAWSENRRADIAYLQ
ncbi:MAG TPA: peptidoglycan-associated lipoprotein Pal [Albitalea sp.]